MSPMMQRYMKSQTTSSASDSAFAIGSRNQASSACKFCCTRQGRQKQPPHRQAILEINPSHNVVKAETLPFYFFQPPSAWEQALKNAYETKPDSVETEDMASGT